MISGCGPARTDQKVLHPRIDHDPNFFVRVKVTPAAQSLGDDKNMSRSDYLIRLEHASIVTTLSNLFISLD